MPILSSFLFLFSGVCHSPLHVNLNGQRRTTNHSNKATICCCRPREFVLSSVVVQRPQKSLQMNDNGFKDSCKRLLISNCYSFD